MGFGGQIWGPGPPKWNFFVFFAATVTGPGGEICRAEILSWGDLFEAKNLKKNLSIFFRENWVQSFWGRGTFSSSPPWGAPFPRLTLGDFGPRDPDKNSFCLGVIAHHLGEIWILAGLHFGPLFLEIGTTDFVILSLIDSTYSLLAILRF